MIRSVRTRATILLRTALATAMIAAPATLLSAGGTQAATSELFFSEYIEGSSFNKAVEIYNGTGGSVDLASGDYEVRIYFNGSASVGTTVDLVGTVDDGDVFVVADDGADPAILAATDQTSTASFFNGDDAVVLVKAGVPIDAIGRIGEDPGSQWGSDLTSTADNTLVRKATVCAGDPDGSDPFDPSIEWDGYPNNTFADLGTHTASCDGGPLPPAPGDLVITEVMQNPSAVFDSAGEWFEIHNVSGTAIDINGWTISDADVDSHVIDNGGPLDVPAGGYVVLGNNDDVATNGGVAVDYEYSSFALANGADEVVLTDPSSVEWDRIEYDGGPTWPDPNGASMNLDPSSTNTLANDDGANWCEATSPYGVGDLGTPGAANTICEEPEPELVFIHDVQGSGSSVAITGEVTVQGIVTSLFERDDVLDGFFVQEEDADADADPATSEGIFVFCRGGCPTVATGDLVTVTGDAVEFFGMSQIDMAFGSGTAVIESSDNALPTPVAVDLPASGSTVDEATFENIEGMLATFTDTLVVSEYFQLARFGQIVLTESSRPYQFTHVDEPSVAGYAAFLDDLARRRIILDDDNNDNNDAISDGPDEAYYYPEGGLSLGNTFRGGDTIDGLTGVMHWSFAGSSGTDAWRIRPVPSAYDYTFSSVNPAPGVPDDVGGSMKVASFNVLNYFTTLDERGADSIAELDRQRAKIASAICALDADVVGLIEIENDGGVSIADLLAGVDGVNENCGPYAAVDTGGPLGTDEIAVGFIYRTATVSPVGEAAVLDGSVDSRFDDDKNRPALAQTFVEGATGGVVTVVVNHLKSKGSSCADVGDPNADDGQGNCNGVRTAAAEAMVDWLATDPTGSGDADVLIIGDLNAYRNEDPIDAIEEGADDVIGSDDDYVDLLEQLIGPDAYTFVFDGQLGYLDHALANQNLRGQVTGVTVWHINADEVNVFDYNDDVRDVPGEASFERETTVGPLYAPDALRSSDHDPVLVGLDLNGSPVCSAAAPSIERLVTPNHKFAPIDVLGVTDPEGDAVTIRIDSIFQDESVDGDGDGSTSPDGEGVGTSTALVRAERDGGGNGRVYHIAFTASDDAGGSCSGEVLVEVPIGKKSVVVDDGALFDSTVAP